jgi:hypothetical protein
VTSSYGSKFTSVEERLAGGVAAPLGLETDVGEGQGREFEQRPRWEAPATRGSKRPQSWMDPATTKRVMGLATTKNAAHRTGGPADNDLHDRQTQAGYNSDQAGAARPESNSDSGVDRTIDAAPDM